jgi:2-polyprenyl-3-methyl-5-hydroxy-6-metoxy-1,4-benzoquinol methylase
MTSAVARQEDVAFQANLYTDPNPTRRGLHQTRRDWVQDQFTRRIRKGTRVLEVGIGCGIFTRALSDLDADVTALDINPAFVAGVAHLKGVDAKVADATKPLPAKDQDVAICSEVLEHVPPSQSIAMLNAIRDALHQDGTLILTTPQSFATVELMARLFRFKPILELARRLYGTADELGHINLLSASALKRQITKAGFTIEQEVRFGFYLPVIAEFGGEAGRSFLLAMEKLLVRVPFVRGLLWTQAYVLRRTG